MASPASRSELESENAELRARLAELMPIAAELEDLRNKYRQLLQLSATVVYEIDLVNLRFIEVNDAMCRGTRYSREELLRMSPLDLLSPDSRGHFLKRYEKMMNGEPVPDSFEAEILAKCGRRYWVAFRVRHILQDGIPQSAFVVVHDKSEVKKSEAARAEALSKYSLLVENANDAILILQDGMIRFHNQKTCDLLGYSREELMQVPFIQLVHPDDREMVIDRHIRRLKGDRFSSTYSFRVILKSGTIGWGEVNAVQVQWEGKSSVLCCVRDVTRQKEAEKELCRARDKLEGEVRKRTAELIEANAELQRKIDEHRRTENALRKSEKKYRMLFDAAQDSVMVLDKEGFIVEVNRGAELLYGYPPDDMLGRNIREFLANSSLPTYNKKFNDLRRMQYADEEIQIVRRDGSILDVWCKCTPFAAGDGRLEGVLVYDRDVTRTKILRDQLIRSERLAATGQLAASVAHEINSPLQGVIGLIDVIKKTQEQPGSNRLKNLRLLEGAFESIRNTVRNLLDLNRPGMQLHQSTDINRIVETTVALVRSNLLKNKIELTLDLSPEIPVIIASPQQISQVIMNLINNAMEAIDGIVRNGGHDTRGAVRRNIVIRTFLRDKRVVLTVSDSGPGISEEDLAYIFDPFFSRKKKMGVGVGLSICHGIVTEHHGRIVAGNLPEGGAVLTVELPVRMEDRK